MPMQTGRITGNLDISVTEIDKVRPQPLVTLVKVCERKIVTCSILS